MNENMDTDDDRLAALLRRLPPAPQAWVEAAAELPARARELERGVPPAPAAESDTVAELQSQPRRGHAAGDES
jgi:hypothetical protein